MEDTYRIALKTQKAPAGIAGSHIPAAGRSLLPAEAVYRTGARGHLVCHAGDRYDNYRYDYYPENTHVKTSQARPARRSGVSDQLIQRLLRIKHYVRPAECAGRFRGPQEAAGLR